MVGNGGWEPYTVEIGLGGHAPNTIAVARYKPEMAESIEQLSFELTANALAEQERVIADLKTRAGTVLAAASIAGSFLGTETHHASLGVCGVLAMVCFVLCVASAIQVLAPQEFTVAIRGEDLLVQDERESSHDVRQAYRAAGRWIEPKLDVNRIRIGHLSDRLNLSCLLLASEAILWTISIIG